MPQATSTTRQAAASQATLRHLKADEVGTTHTHGTEPTLVEFIHLAVLGTSARCNVGLESNGDAVQP